MHASQLPCASNSLRFAFVLSRSQTGTFKENMMATVGFNMHKVQKGKVVIKVWDMGGQEKYRGMWERCQSTVQRRAWLRAASCCRTLDMARQILT